MKIRVKIFVNLIICTLIIFLVKVDVFASPYCRTCGSLFQSKEVIKEPTCSEYGTLRLTCPDGHTWDDLIVPSAHTWDEGTVTIEPTFTEAGEKTYTCTVCHKIKREVIPIRTDILEPTPEPTPDPSPEPTPTPEPDPIIIYDGMETISENSLRFYEDTGQRLYNIERGVNAISSNMIPVISGINSIRDDHIDIKQYIQSVSENTAELVRLNKNDINNTEMLEQLSGNIDKLNTRLTELSTYLGYFFAFMIFIMIVIIFKGCWKLIDKYLLNVTLR